MLGAVPEHYLTFRKLLVSKKTSEQIGIHHGALRKQSYATDKPLRQTLQSVVEIQLGTVMALWFEGLIEDVVHLQAIMSSRIIEK